MRASDLLTACKFFGWLSLLLAIAFAIARDSWHTMLFAGGVILWIINIVIWSGIKEQEDESSKY
jgi:hypothetical protein